MKSPWTLPRHVTASVAFDPVVPLAIPAPRMSDDAYEALYRARVRANEDRRDRAKEERVLVFLREQAL